jgi:PAS domain S-box-containing protein
LFETSAAYAAIASLDGRLEIISPSWERNLGYSPQELIGQPYLTLVHPDDVESTLRATQTLLKEGTNVADFLNRYRTKTGDYRWLLWNAVSRSGVVYAVALDVTEQKELEQQQKRLLQRHKLALQLGDIHIEHYDWANSQQLECTAGPHQKHGCKTPHKRTLLDWVTSEVHPDDQPLLKSGKGFRNKM